MWLKIGELARRAGLTVRTLHHYDAIGLLSPSARSENGFRWYNQADVVRLHRIQALKQFGCSLSEIGAFLAEPGASLIEIITRQVSVLDSQVQHAQALRERLVRLREQILKGEETGLTDWLTLLEMMTMYEKHLSKEELEILRSKKAAGNLDDAWSRLISAVRDAMERGMAPESEESHALAWQWIQLLRETTGNDPGLAMKLKKIHREEPNAQLLKGITHETIDFISESFASARAAILAKYLTPDELAAVRERQAAQAAEWPPLIAELRPHLERGTAPSDPAVQELARRWGALFREAYSGDDPKLEAKIRTAFQKEPNLLLSVGMDAALLGLVQKARRHLKSVRGNAAPADPVPKPSALRVASYRAAHQLLDRPLVFEDPLAFRILGEDEEQSLRSDPERHNIPLLRGLRTSVVVRSRLAEDEWARSHTRGLRQYVILGAGLDTFAYRNPDQESRIFEVDLPTTQQWKRNCLRTAGIQEPASLTFVPIDFETSTLAEALEQAGFSRAEPAFFSWLGVTMYLEEEALLSTLRFIAGLAPGSGVVFDYAVPSSLQSPTERRAMEFLAARVAEHGEPWKTYLDPAFLVETLRSLGFTEIEDYGPELLNARYLSGRQDGLRKGGVSRLICARV